VRRQFGALRGVAANTGEVIVATYLTNNSDVYVADGGEVVTRSVATTSSMSFPPTTRRLSTPTSIISKAATFTAIWQRHDLRQQCRFRRHPAWRFR